MTELIEIATAVSAAAYVAVALWTYRTLRRPNPPPDPPDSWPDVAVIVAARDEEAVLAPCLEALLAQDYQGRWSVIVVDDGSADRTPEIAAEIAATAADPSGTATGDRVGGKSGEGMSRISLCRGGPGKAAALQAGVAESDAEILITTDADCRPPAGWVRGLVVRLLDTGADVLGGCTVVSGRRPVEAVEALDWALMLALTSAASEAGHPITAMGNNMAFRRAALDAVGGFDGDSVTEDYAFFRAVGRRDRRAAHLVMAADVRNSTLPVGRWSGLWAQRLRWARGGLRASSGTWGLYSLVWLAHALPLVALFAGALLWGLTAIAVRWFVDHLVLRAASARLGAPLHMGFQLLQEGWLTLCVLGLPVSLLANRSIPWKGRSYS